MKRKFYIPYSLIFIIILCAWETLHAQDSSLILSPKTAADTGNVSVKPSADTMQSAIPPVPLPTFANHSFASRPQFVQYLLTHNKLFLETGDPLSDLSHLVKKDETTQLEDQIFYILMGIFFLLAIIRIAFRKYFSDLFKAFFNPALSRRQLKEQLFQTPFPAFLLNLFFNISVGLYLYIVLWHFNYITPDHPLYLIGIFILLFIFIYLVKYIFLRFSGWLFGYPELMNSYIFTLYLVNKILGVVLLPFILILAFSPPVLGKIALNISIIIIILMIVYRYVRVFPTVQNQISFNKFHFFLYLCGFEIAPILIIGKLVLIWLNGA